MATAKKTTGKSKAPAKSKANPLQTVQSISALHTELLVEIESFVTRENKAAGKRARKALQEIRKLSATARKEIQEVVNSRRGK
jgi:hypothetical protein